MAELPQMPWFPRDYQADTRHLTLEEHGAYRMLLDLLWIGNCSGLPSDDKRLARMLGITPREWKKIKPEVITFFYEKEDGFYSHTRVEKEYTRISKRVEQNRQNARGKPLENNEEGVADGEANDAAEDAAKSEQAKSETGSETPLTQNHNQNQRGKGSPTTTTESSSAGEPNDRDEGGGGPEFDPLYIPKHLRREPEDKSKPEMRKRPPLAEQFDHNAPMPDHPGKPIAEAYMAVVNEVYGSEHTLLHAGHGAQIIGERWVKAGADLAICREVFQTVLATRKGKGQQPPSTMEYFEQPVARAIQQAKTPMADAGQGGFGKQADAGVHPDSERNTWVIRVQGFHERGFWMERWGPEPGKPGCECPKDIQVQFQAEGAE